MKKKFIFEGDGELFFEKQKLICEHNVKSFKEELMKIHDYQDSGLHFINDANEMSERIEYTYGGYTELWKGTFTSADGKDKFRVKGTYGPDFEDEQSNDDTDLYLQVDKVYR